MQFLPYLESTYNLHHFAFLDDKTYDSFKKNKLFTTSLRVLFLLFKPLSLVFKVKKNDILFIHRDIYPFGPFWLERFLKSRGAKIIFDLDDAIFLEETTEITNKKNKILYRLKYGKRYNQIIGLADLVICGNEFLANYCKKINPNTYILPTVIDLTKVKVAEKNRQRPATDNLTFGWIGNPGNSQYFSKILPIFDQLSLKYKRYITFKCIGGKIIYIPKSPYFNISQVEWSEETEYDELISIDVGIMPLKNSSWSKGKCGLKILQYMSVSKPTIADAVGVNKKIIDHMKNGFLVYSLQEWQYYIEMIISDFDKNDINKLGENAYKKFREKYTLQGNIKVLKGLINKLI